LVLRSPRRFSRLRIARLAPALIPPRQQAAKARVVAITRVEARITAGRGIAREERKGNAAQ
jgi:hypothetical protein